ncbi:MAG: BamA/TamA family outer membrane protein [candidate division Zixibacteria bacterium]|nr:BamA/TamA family outer membrane protein [candidate division Zixibacteria bacterium]
MRVFNLKIFLVCLILSLLTSMTTASGTNIVVTSNVTDNQLQARLDRLQAFLPSRSIIDSMTYELESAGYFSYSVLLVGDSLTIESGPLYSLGDIIVTEVSIDGSKKQTTNKQWRDLPATKENIKKVKAKIIYPYQVNGFYFASLSLEGMTLGNNLVELSFKVLTGPTVKVERLRFKGLTKTRPEFVRRLVGVSQGDTLRDEKLSEWIQTMNRLEYLSIDSLPQLIPNQTYDAVELLFFVSEKERNFLELSGGYLPSRGDEKGEFVGRFEYKARNLFGSGRKFRFLYDKRDRNISIRRISFSQPFFVPQYLELSIQADQTDYDSLYHAFSLKANVRMRLSVTADVQTFLSWTKTEPQNSSQFSSRSLAGGFSYLYSTIVRDFNPQRGLALQGSASYIRRTSWPDSVSTEVIRNESTVAVDYDLFQPVFQRVLMRVRLYSQMILTSRTLIPYSEQLKFGGYQSLRGYRQDEFAGRRIALLQYEVRYRPSDVAAIYIFSDVGYIYQRRIMTDESTTTNEFTRLGAGLGMLFGTQTARLTLEAAWGEGDSPGDGKIHFGLITSF